MHGIKLAEAHQRHRRTHQEIPVVRIGLQQGTVNRQRALERRACAGPPAEPALRVADAFMADRKVALPARVPRVRSRKTLTDRKTLTERFRASGRSPLRNQNVTHTVVGHR